MNLKCPRCKKSLISSDFETYNQNIQEITLSSMVVDVCQSCGGIWFDKGELEQIHDDIEITFIEIKKVPNSREQNILLNCPKCKTAIMEKVQNVRDKKVIMDICPSCKGVWLDGGELKAIQQENLFKVFFSAVSWILKS